MAILRDQVTLDNYSAGKTDMALAGAIVHKWHCLNNWFVLFTADCAT